MLQSFSPWWRALVVVLFGLATLTWPHAATAATTRTPTLVHQDEVVLAPKSAGSFSFTLNSGGASDARVAVSVYGHLVARSQLAEVVDNTGSPTALLATTATLPLSCVVHDEQTLRVTLGLDGSPRPLSDCGAPSGLVLNLHCSSSCSGVYPIQIAVTTPTTTTRLWSLLSVVTTHIERPLQLAWILDANPTTPASQRASASVLSVFSNHTAAPVTLSLNYEGALAAQWSTNANADLFRTAYQKALSLPNVDEIAGPPSNIDYAGLSAHGLSGEVATQLSQSTLILGGTPSNVVQVSGRVSSDDLSALATSGATDVVVPESDLRTAPSQTLNWGAPFTVAGDTKSLLVTNDGPLSALSTDDDLGPGRQAALTLGTLAFLHFEEPYAPSVRTLLLTSSLSQLRPSYVNQLLSGLRVNPFVSLVPLRDAFDNALVATNGAPATRELTSTSSSTWSTQNVSSLLQVTYNTTSLAASASSAEPGERLVVQRLRGEIRSSSTQRQTRINAVTTALDTQLSHFAINEGAITLTGSVTSLPITLTSSADYTVNGIVTLRGTYLHTRMRHVAIALSAPTRSIRVPATITGTGSFTLQVVFSSSNGRLVLARGAIQVRNAPTSIVGYVLTFASLLVLGLWWWRTHRRTARGRHAK